MPRELQHGLTRAKEARRGYRDMNKRYDRGVTAATDQLASLESPTGRVLKSIGGVTLYERWIQTPRAAAR